MTHKGSMHKAYLGHRYAGRQLGNHQQYESPFDRNQGMCKETVCSDVMHQSMYKHPDTVDYIHKDS